MSRTDEGGAARGGRGDGSGGPPAPPSAPPAATAPTAPTGSSGSPSPEASADASPRSSADTTSAAEADAATNSSAQAPTPADGMDLARQALASARAASRRSAAGDGSPTGRSPIGRSTSGGARGRSAAQSGRTSGQAARAAGERRGSGEPQLSGSRPDERDPQPVGSLVSRITEERGWSQDLAVGGVLGRWSDLVGAEVAAHCQPEAFADGLLVVRTDSTAWATQVRLLAPTLLARLAEEVGRDVVRRVQVRGPSAPSWRKGPLNVRGRGPRDTYG